MLSIHNFQKAAWKKLFSEDIYKIFEQASFVDHDISVTYTPSNADKLLNLGSFSTKMDATLAEILRVNIRLVDLSDDTSSQSTLSAVEFKDIPLLNLPLLTEFGFMLNGSKKGVVSELRPASGWYFTTRKEVPALVLQASANPKFMIYQSKLKKSKTPTTIVSHVTKDSGTQEIHLFEFLKALSDSATYDDIIADLQFNRRAMADYIASNNNEPNMEQCARKVLSTIMGDKSSYTDPVKELHKQFYTRNRLMIGPEHAPRFKNFISYLKVVGYPLSRSLKLDGMHIPEGTIVTTEIASRLDDLNVPVIYIKLDGTEVPLVKCECSENLTYSEVITAVYQYYLLLDGIGSIDSQDNYCNKVLDTVAFKYSGYIRKALYKVSSYIQTRFTNKIVLEDAIVAGDLQTQLQQIDVIHDIGSDSMYQHFDETNSLSSLEQSFRISAGSEHAASAQRDVQKSQYGRTDAFTTSESKKVGLNLSLATLAGIDKFGFITTPVYQVIKGKVMRDQVIQISAIDERGKAIASHDANIEALYAQDPNALILCRIDGEVLDMPISQVKYQYIAACQSLGPLMAMVPAANHDAGKRSTMSGNAQKQALPVIRRERPVVCTGTEALMDVGIVRGSDVIESALSKQGIFEITDTADYTLTIVEVAPQSNITLVHYTTTYPGLSGTLEYELPRVNSTVKGSLRHFRINSTNGNTYGPNDIVFHANDIDVKPCQLSSTEVNFGNITQPASSIADHAVALGNNVKVMFKSLEGSGYEDALIVNADFIQHYGLAVNRVVSHTIELEREESNGIVTEHHFTREIAELSEVEKSWLDASGLPLPGTRLKSGQVLVGRLRIETLPDGTQTPSNACIRLQATESGTVISSQLSDDGTKAKITLGVIETLEDGDKLSGYHGNKGVVSKVLPAEDMPYTASAVPDIIINPLGVPARQNLGQIIEAALGARAVHEGVIQLLEPFNDLPMDELLEQLKSSGVVLEDVYDGRTGMKMPRQGMIGVMHFIRSEHVSLSKYNACSSANDKLSPRTGQPVKAGGGGQKYSELTNWCLESYGASCVIDTLTAFQSDDIANINKFVHAIKNGTPWEKCELPYESHNADLMQAYLRTFGLNIVKSGDTSKIQILSDEQMHALAPKECNLQYPTDRDILRDPNVFGESSNRVDGLLSARKKYGYLPTSFEFIQPILLSQADFLKMFYVRAPTGEVRPMSHNLYSSFLDDMLCFKEFELTTGLPIIAETFKAQQRKDRTLIQEVRPEQRLDENTGICGLMKIFKGYDFSTSIRQINREFQAKEDDLQFLGSVKVVSEYSMDAVNSGCVIDNVMYVIDTPTHMKALEIRNLIKEFMHYYDLQEVIVKGVLVPPIGYRPLIRKESSSAFDIQLGAVVLSLKILSRLKPGTNEYANRCNRIYKTIADMLSSSRSASGADRNRKTVFDEFTAHESKNSIIRDSILSKRLRYSGRSVISIDSSFKIDYVGVPVVMATKIFEDHLVAMLTVNSAGDYPVLRELAGGDPRLAKRILSFIGYQNYRGFAALLGTTSNIYKEFMRCKDELIRMLESLFEYYYCLLNREPSLHKFSVTGFKAAPVWCNSIKLHPLSCHGFNADFDGDQMSVVFPQHPRAQEELKRLMMMSTNLVNPKDGKLIVSFNQDMILGMYWATMLENNRVEQDLIETPSKAVISMKFSNTPFQDYKNLELSELWTLFEMGSIKIHDVVMVATPDGKIYKSTAGRILFNSILPNMQGFTDEPDPAAGGRGRFYKLRFTEPLRKSNLEKALKWASEYYDSTSCLDTLPEFLDRVKDFGFLMADLGAVSISIYDFAGVKVLDEINQDFQQVKDRVNAINDYAKSGYIVESERKRLVIDEWMALRDNHVTNIMNGLDRNSNLFIMIDSSARGDIHQLMEMCGIIGNISNAKGQMLETPVLSNYFRGLSSQDLFASSYKARHAIMAAQLSTAEVGEMNRGLIYLVDHTHTRESSTSCSALPTMIPLDYELNTDIPSTLTVVTQDVNTLPDSYFGNGLTRESWNEFVSFIDNYARSTMCYAATKRLICIAKLPRVIVADTNGNIRLIDLKYKLTPQSRAMLWYRAYETENLDAKYVGKGMTFVMHPGDPELNIVGDEVISLIEMDLPATFPIYTIIGCKSLSGTCKRCFGIKYDTKQLPVGIEHTGYQAIQAIGEPTQQLVLDTHKTSGAKGKATGGRAGIDAILRKPMEIPKGVEIAAIAPASGVLELSGNKLESLHASIGGVMIASDSINASNLLYLAGNYVESGAVLTTGMVPYQDMIERTDYRNVQLQFWKAYLRLYAGENIMARNFELLVLAQTEFGKANEDGPEVLAGKVYPIRMLQNIGAAFTPTILPSQSAIINRGKVYCAVAHSRSLERLCKFAVTGMNNIEESNIGKGILGELRSRNADRPIGIIRIPHPPKTSSNPTGTVRGGTPLPQTSRRPVNKPTIIVPVEISSTSPIERVYSINTGTGEVYESLLNSPTAAAEIDSLEFLLKEREAELERTDAETEDWISIAEEEPSDSEVFVSERTDAFRDM